MIFFSIKFQQEGAREFAAAKLLSARGQNFILHVFLF